MRRSRVFPFLLCNVFVPHVVHTHIRYVDQSVHKKLPAHKLSMQLFGVFYQCVQKEVIIQFFPHFPFSFFFTIII